MQLYLVVHIFRLHVFKSVPWKTFKRFFTVHPYVNTNYYCNKYRNWLETTPTFIRFDYIEPVRVEPVPAANGMGSFGQPGVPPDLDHLWDVVPEHGPGATQIHSCPVPMTLSLASAPSHLFSDAPEGLPWQRSPKAGVEGKVLLLVISGHGL